MKKIAGVLCAFSLFSLAACGDNTPPPAPVQAALSETDAAFVQKASGINGLEVAIGKLAVTNSKNKQVIAFGETLAKDHFDSEARLTSLVSAHNITLTSGLSADDQKIVDDLTAKKGTAFDRAFLSAVIADHQDAANVYATEASSSTQNELKGYATEMSAETEKHLAEAQKLSAVKAATHSHKKRVRHK